MDATLAPGTVLAGKFRVERVLGEGGMGIVVAAFHLGLHQRVAIKFLHERAARSEDVVARFLREGRAAVRIQSEHVARVTDVGVLESGAPYLVLEYLEGRDLGKLVTERGPLPVDEAVEYVLQACEAIAEAHALGIVHRDLKPANVFHTLRRDGSPCVKVLDFGISKMVTPDEQQALTRTTGPMGSPLYMSPEQLRSARDVDARTDVWALGVILFELMTATLPFVAEDVPRLTLRIVEAAPTPLSSLRPDAPAGVEAVILRCLEKDPASRFPDVAAFAQALSPFAPPRALASVDRIARVLAAAPKSTGPMPSPPMGATLSATEPSAPARTPAIARTAPMDEARGVTTAPTIHDPAAFGPAPTPVTRSPRALWIVALALFVVGVGVVAAFALRSTPVREEPSTEAPASRPTQRAKVAAIELPSEVPVPSASSADKRPGSAPPKPPGTSSEPPKKGAAPSAPPSTSSVVPPLPPAPKPSDPVWKPGEY